MQYDFVEEVAVENKRLCFSQSPRGLSALVFAVDAHQGTHLTEARREVFRVLMRLASDSGRAAWLIAGHSYPQPDTTVKNYHRLWSGLARAGISFNQVTGGDEIKISSQEGIRYFGYKKISIEDAVVADKVLRRTQSFIALTRNISELHFMINGGWNSVGVGAPQEAFERSLQANIPIAIVLGEFDDSSAEGALVAPAKTLESFQRFLR